MKLREDYLKATKKEKGLILDEYVKNTKHNRKYVITVLNAEERWAANPPCRKRKRQYGPEIEVPLVKLWKIFDFPCGQRLKPCLENELERLRRFGEIKVSEAVTEKLKKISSATIDRRLKVPRNTEHKRRFATTRPGSLLKRKIPVRLTEWDTKIIGFLETDLVAHCGGNAAGEYLHSVSLTEIATGWWEGEAIMGRGQKATFESLKEMRARTPFPWKGLDSDNGGEFINHLLFGYCRDEEITFTRSRENKKNDNAYVEQKNWTHVRKLLGYFRYDTSREQAIINDLYHHEVRLYKNFFQPVMKLKQKIRFGAKKHRKYEPAKTPFQRMVVSDQIDDKTKERLNALYQNLNPAALKRTIELKLCLLLKTYQAKRKGAPRPTPRKEVISVRF